MLRDSLRLSNMTAVVCVKNVNFRVEVPPLLFASNSLCNSNFFVYPQIGFPRHYSWNLSLREYKEHFTCDARILYLGCVLLEFCYWCGECSVFGKWISTSCCRVVNLGFQCVGLGVVSDGIRVHSDWSILVVFLSVFCK